MTFIDIKKAKNKIPDVDSILGEAFINVNPKSKDIEKRFGEILVKLDQKAEEIYRGYEKEAIRGKDLTTEIC